MSEFFQRSLWTEFAFGLCKGFLPNHPKCSIFEKRFRIYCIMIAVEKERGAVITSPRDGGGAIH